MCVSPNIKVNPIKIPKDYQKIKEKLPEVFISENSEWKQTVLNSFQHLKNVHKRSIYINYKHYNFR